MAASTTDRTATTARIQRRGVFHVWTLKRRYGRSSSTDVFAGNALAKMTGVGKWSGFPHPLCRAHVQNLIWGNKMIGSYAIKQQALFESANFAERSCAERPELSESEAITGAQRGDAEAFECI